MNKSILTNLIALAVVLIGLLMQGEYRQLVLNTGLFAFSGGMTNWLAIYMLFEKVPGFFGSGVIPARFEEFKSGIKLLIMNQFFTKENINNFFNEMSSGNADEKESGIDKLVDGLDMDKAFDGLVEVITNSSFGSMLAMVGGVKALEPLQAPFVSKMKEFIKDVGKDAGTLNKFKDGSTSDLLSKIENIVDHRLEELTPQLVKEIIQDMIRIHLGWLVVWGGVLGGIIGLCVALFIQ